MPEESQIGGEVEESEREIGATPSNETTWGRFRRRLLECDATDKGFISLRVTLNDMVQQLREVRALWEKRHGISSWKKAEIAFEDDNRSIQLWRAYGAASLVQVPWLAAEELARIRYPGMRYLLSSGRKGRVCLTDCGLEEFLGLVPRADAYLRQSFQSEGTVGDQKSTRRTKIVITMRIVGDGLRLTHSSSQHSSGMPLIRDNAMRLLLALNDRKYRQVLERNVTKPGHAHEYLGDQVWGQTAAGSRIHGHAADRLRQLARKLNQKLLEILGNPPAGDRWIVNEAGAYELSRSVCWHPLRGDFLQPVPPALSLPTQRKPKGSDLRREDDGG